MFILIKIIQFSEHLCFHGSQQSEEYVRNFSSVNAVIIINETFLRLFTIE